MEKPEGGIPPEGGIFEYTVSLMRTHLCQALDMYFAASTATGSPWSWQIRSHSALSSVIHAFCAFETSVNEVGHLMFFYEENKLYIPPDNRGRLLKKTISGWNKVSCLDKYELIIDEKFGEIPSSNQMSRLRELNTLRNWIAHGFAFQSTELLIPNHNGNFHSIDREDSAKWGTKFPHLKFNRMDELDHSDARKAIVTAIDGLLQMHRVLGIPLIFNSLHAGPNNTVANYPEKADEIFDGHLASHDRRLVEISL